MGTSKSKSKKPSSTKDGGVSVVVNAETKIPGIDPGAPEGDHPALIICDDVERRRLEREFAEASKNAAIVPVRTPESVYQISKFSDNVPYLLRCILTEIMR